MLLTTGTEIIFRDELKNVQKTFFEYLIKDSFQFSLLEPKSLSDLGSIDMIDILYHSEYVDLIFNKKLRFVDYEIPDVFVNIGIDNRLLDVLFYFDLRDFDSHNYKNIVDSLFIWSKQISQEYNIKEFVCQIDNANPDEFYFNQDQFGIIYYQL